MNRTVFRLKLIFPLLLTTLFLGCPDDNGGPGAPETDYVTEIRSGWREFENLNFELALEHFDVAMELNSEGVEGFSGAGWTNYFLREWADAATAWNGGVNLTTGDVNDIQIGLALLDYRNADFAGAADMITVVLTENSSYRFEHKPGIEAISMHWLKAQCFYLTGNMQSAYDEVLLNLNPNLRLDITTGEGQTALGEELENLGRESGWIDILQL